jgi:hypothetical protein
VKTASLDLLVEAHNKGVALRIVGNELEFEGPKESITEGFVVSLRLHKRELMDLLKWDEELAYRLIRDALAHLNEFYVDGSDLSVLDAWEDRINEAYGEEDMSALRIALNGYVNAGLLAFRGEEDA